MRHYVMVSGLIFALVAVAQLVRVVMAWPVQIGFIQRSELGIRDRRPHCRVTCDLGSSAQPR